MKETYIQPESLWISNYPELTGSFYPLDQNRKTSAVLTTGYIPMYKIVSSVRNDKKAYREDPNHNFILTQNDFITVVPGVMNEPLYLCFQLINDNNWNSRTRLNGFQIKMRFTITVQARFWVEWNNLREWLEDVAVDLRDRGLNNYFVPPPDIFIQLPPTLPAEETPPPREYYPPRGQDAIADTLPKFIPWATRQPNDTQHIRSQWVFNATQP
jgi:hypothetical protein